MKALLTLAFFLVLQTTANICASEDLATWVDNVGRHNQFHAGFCADADAFDVAGAYKRARNIPSHHSAPD